MLKFARLFFVCMMASAIAIGASYEALQPPWEFGEIWTYLTQVHPVGGEAYTTRIDCLGLIGERGIGLAVIITEEWATTLSVISGPSVAEVTATNQISTPVVKWPTFLDFVSRLKGGVPPLTVVAMPAVGPGIQVEHLELASTMGFTIEPEGKVFQVDLRLALVAQEAVTVSAGTFPRAYLTSYSATWFDVSHSGQAWWDAAKFAPGPLRADGELNWVSYSWELLHHGLLAPDELLRRLCEALEATERVSLTQALEARQALADLGIDLPC